MSDAKPYTMERLQELADDGVHLVEIDDADLCATVRALEAAEARVKEFEATPCHPTKEECDAVSAFECDMLEGRIPFGTSSARAYVTARDAMRLAEARAEKAEARLREVAERAWEVGSGWQWDTTGRKRNVARREAVDALLKEEP